jgi:hypothetical protein
MPLAESVEQIKDVAESDKKIIERVEPYTMTSPLRVEALTKAVRYCIERDIPGAMVECGVWRGGSILAIILQLLDMGVTDRDIYLYDTFEGMTEPTDKDISKFHEPALKTWNRHKAMGKKAWDYFFTEELFNEEAVRRLLVDTGYPESRLHFVRGTVEETIPAIVPDNIAILRLDTDWYESTRHELVHLYPRLQSGGVLIIDDYGHWDGARVAVDEFFARDDVKATLLHRIDYAGRAAIKV